MERRKDGSYIFDSKELLNDNVKVSAKIYPLNEHQFHVLIQKSDTKIEETASKILFLGIGVLLQVLVLLIFVCYYHLKGYTEEVDSTLSHIDKIQIGFIVICLVISCICKIISLLKKSERKLLVSEIMSHFKK